MTQAVTIAIVGVATLVLVVYEALCMMRLRRMTQTRPRFRQVAGLALASREPAPGVRALARRVLAARLGSYAGIAALMVMLASL